MAIGLPFAQGLANGIDVNMLWQTGANPASEASACGHPLNQTPGNDGSLVLSTNNGIVGSTTTVNGSGFRNGETVSISWDSTSGTRLGTVTAGSNGSFALSVTIPEAVYGSHSVIARGGTSGKQEDAPFTVRPSLSRVPTSGKPGTGITVTARGFGANESVLLTWDSAGGQNLGSATTNANGTATRVITIPASTVGSHDYTGGGSRTGARAYGAIYVEAGGAVPTAAPTRTPVGTATATTTATPASGSGTAIVTGTGGGGVNCRTTASTSGAVIVVLAEGATVQLNGTAQGGWQPVFCGGRSGFVSAQYLTISATLTPSSTRALAATATPTRTPLRTAATTPSPTPSVMATTVLAGSNPSFSGDQLPIASSSTTSETNASTQAHDGNTGTSWFTTAANPASAALTVDLGEVRQLSGVKWIYGMSGGADLMILTVSSDGTNWKQLVIMSNRQPQTWEGWATTETARYVRLTFANPNGSPILGYVAELQVWGSTGASGETRRAAVRSAPTAPSATLSPSAVAGTPVAITPTNSTPAVIVPAVQSTPSVTPTATPESSTATVTPTAELPTATATALPVEPTVIPTEESTPTATATEAPLPTPTAELPTPPGPSTIGYIGGTGGDGAFCRIGPDAGSESIVLLPEGTEVQVYGDPTGDWQSVTCNGVAGFVFASFISAAPVAALPTPAPADLPTPTSETQQTDSQSPDLSAEPVLEPALEPTLEPTAVPELVSREQVVSVSADASVNSVAPDQPQAGESGTTLTSGGADGATTVLTFDVEGVGTGTIVAARLVVTGSGETAGAGGPLLVAPGVGFDEYGVTQSQVNGVGLGSAGWIASIQPGAETSIDVTGIVTADGTISFAIQGTPEQVVGIASRESGAPAYLVLTIQGSAVPAVAP